MTEVILPFLIFITNPIGVGQEIGYAANVMYEKYVVQGESAPRPYQTLEECTAALQTVRNDTRALLQTRNVMPEYRMVMLQRVGSMKCLRADARPDTPVKHVEAKTAYRWRIGRLNAQGYFEGQSLNLRQFDTQQQCAFAYNETIPLYGEALGQRGVGGEEVRRLQKVFSDQYRCMAVLPNQAQPQVPLQIVQVLPAGMAPSNAPAPLEIAIPATSWFSPQHPPHRFTLDKPGERLTHDYKLYYTWRKVRSDQLPEFELLVAGTGLMSGPWNCQMIVNQIGEEVRRVGWDFMLRMRPDLVRLDKSRSIDSLECRKFK